MIKEKYHIENNKIVGPYGATELKTKQEICAELNYWISRVNETQELAEKLAGMVKQ